MTYRIARTALLGLSIVSLIGGGIFFPPIAPATIVLVIIFLTITVVLNVVDQ